MEGLLIEVRRAPPAAILPVARMVCDELLHELWRVEKSDHTPEWILEYIGHLPKDPPRTVHCSDYDELPEWVKDRMAVLYMLDAHPHTSIVFGVGRRVKEHAFWVVRDRGVHGGNP
jgi:hypothetical protein